MFLSAYIRFNISQKPKNRGLQCQDYPIDLNGIELRSPDIIDEYAAPDILYTNINIIYMMCNNSTCTMYLYIGIFTHHVAPIYII